MLEDDLNIVRVVKPAIEAQGWEFQAVQRIADAAEPMGRFKPDILLLDVELPDGNGLDYCASVRRDRKTEPVIIFLTTKGDLESRLKGFSAGGQDYVAKPFAVEELLARLRAHLRIKSEPGQPNSARTQDALKDRLHQDLADMVAHDLRSPMATLRATLRMIRDSQLLKNDEYEWILTDAEFASNRVLFMMNNMMDLGAGAVRADPAPIAFAPFAHRVRSMVEAELQHRKITMRLELPEAEIHCSTDRMLLLRVAVNLLWNAIDRSKPDGKVVLRIVSAGDSLRLEVSDQGPGIPDHEKAGVFLRGKQGDGADSAAPEPNGISLAFCRLACQTMGGSIWIEDNPGGGSRVVAEVPSHLASQPSQEESRAQFGPEIMEQYLEACRDQLEEARRHAAETAGPKPGPAIKKLRVLFHQLAGSAGTYGCMAAGTTATSLLGLLPSSSGETRLDEKTRGKLLSGIDSIWAELKLGDSR